MTAPFEDEMPLEGSRPPEHDLDRSVVAVLLRHALVLAQQFFSKDKEGNPTQWDPAEIGPTLNKFVFGTVNPGIARLGIGG